MKSRLWVGLINGHYVVYDENIQIAKSKWVVLFFCHPMKYVSYLKLYARTVIKSVEPDIIEYDESIKTYLTWYEKYGVSNSEEIQKEVLLRDEKLAERISSLKSIHKKRVEDSGKVYTGVGEPTKYIRTTVCHSCHRTISSNINLECLGCKWIICPKCGACGCDY